MKKLYILIGPKGAGKTYIGTRVAEQTDIKFLRVEPIWLSLAAGEDGWQRVEAEIAQLFKEHDRVMIESLGAGDGFQGMYTSLAQKYQIKLIRVLVDLDESLRRVRHRSNKDHIPISDDKVEAYNKIAAQVSYPWDAVIDNNGPASLAEILKIIESV